MKKNVKSDKPKKRYTKQILPEAKAKRSNPVDLTDGQKQHIKENYKKLSPSKLGVEERKYYNKIKAGKARAQTSYRYKGQFLSEKIVDLGKRTAKVKKVSFDTFLSKGGLEALAELEGTGLLQDWYFMETVRSMIKKSKKKYVVVNEEKMNRTDALFKLTMFNNEIVSNTNTAAIEIKVGIDASGRMHFSLPPEDFSSEDYYSNDELIEAVAEYEIRLHISDISSN